MGALILLVMIVELDEVKESPNAFESIKQTNHLFSNICPNGKCLISNIFIFYKSHFVLIANL